MYILAENVECQCDFSQLKNSFIYKNIAFEHETEPLMIINGAMESPSKRRGSVDNTMAGSNAAILLLLLLIMAVRMSRETNDCQWHPRPNA